MFGFNLSQIALVLCLSQIPGSTSQSAIHSATFVYTNPSSMQTMKSWLLCGSFPIKTVTPEAQFVRKNNNRGVNALDDSIYKAAFEFDYLTEQGGETQSHPSEGEPVVVAGNSYSWKLFSVPSDEIDLRSLFNPSEDVVVYAYAEIDMPTAKPMILSFGSDDGIKVWLNGQPIFEKFTGRSFQLDEDFVEAQLLQGKNRLLIKIQNMTLDYSFSCRLIDRDDAKKLEFKKKNPNSVHYFFNLFSGFFHND